MLLKVVNVVLVPDKYKLENFAHSLEEKEIYVICWLGGPYSEKL